MAWISPTGHIADSGWATEARAYDDNLNLSATFYKEDEDDTWTPFLELTHAALNCDKVRFRLAASDSDEVDLDVWYGDAWHHLFQGTWLLDNTWYEKAIPGGPFLVTKMRLRLFCPTGDEWDAYVKEVDFNEVAAGIAIPVAMHHYKQLRN